MASGKKSIIVYAEWIEIFDSLSDDEAGKLIKHFFKYVNDLQPIAPDRITEISFIPIKQSLKRDLIKWSETIDKRAQSGRIGGLKSGEARQSKTKQTEANEANEANASNLKQTEANEAVNVNVNDNVNVLTKVNIPTELEFMEYAKKIEGYNPKLETSVKLKYLSWVENKWMDGNNKKIKNWKSKLLNTIPYLKPIENNQPQSKIDQLINLKYGS